MQLKVKRANDVNVRARPLKVLEGLRQQKQVSNMRCKTKCITFFLIV